MKTLQYYSFDEEDEPVIVSVWFTISSFESFEPSQISTDLGIEPNEAWAKGDSYLGKVGDLEKKKVVQVMRQRPVSIWRLDSQEFIDSRRVENHIDALLEVLLPREKELEYYVNNERFVVRFQIAVKGFDVAGSYSLSNTSLLKMGSLSNLTDFSYSFLELVELQESS